MGNSKECIVVKKRYIVLISVINIQILVVSFLSQNNVIAQTWVGNAIGTVIFFLPIQILLFTLSKDNDLSIWVKSCCKIGFWFVIICFLLGGIALMVGQGAE